MRTAFLAIPSLLALACAGGLWAVASRAKNSDPAVVPFEPKHLVTPQMTSKTDSMAGETAQAFSEKDVTGKAVEIGGRALKRPQFVYFVQTECPCSYAAEPMFHALADQFKGHVDFISVTNADVAASKRWTQEMDVPYPVISDTKKSVIKAYRATSSAYSALITTDGKIEKMWPGFSRDLLLDMNREIAKATGQPEKSFDTQYAPIKQATGCDF